VILNFHKNLLLQALIQAAEIPISSLKMSILATQLKGNVLGMLMGLLEKARRRLRAGKLRQIEVIDYYK